VAVCNIGSEFQIEHNAAVGLIRFGAGEAYLVASGSACRAALLAIGIAVGIGNTSNGALAGADCVARGRASTSSTQYRISLSPPDYLNAEAVQQHFIFSRIWGAVLKERFTSSTRGACNSIVLPLIFPDLFAELFPNGRDVNGEQCLAELHGLLRDSPPSTATIASLSNAIADELAKAPSKQQMYVAVDYLFRRALREIYTNGSVMHALMSVDQAGFRSTDPADFQEWLTRQIASKPPLITRIPFCEEATSQTEVPGERASIPYSPAVQSDVIKLQLPRDEAAQVLDRMLLLGVPEQKAIGGQVPWQAESFSVGEFCNKRRKFAVSGQPESEKDLQINCLHVAPFGAAWVVFFCDPKDCSFPGDADMALKTIKQSIEAHGEAQKLAGGHEPRGPYLIEVHSNQN
jgi:hypothetical protein